MSFLFNNFLSGSDEKKSDMDMCDRLKVLSQKELDEIDMKIMKYKKSAEITVLDKSLHELQELVNLKRQEWQNLQTKYSKEKEKFDAINRNKISYESTVATLERKIASVEKETEQILLNTEDLKAKEEELNAKLIVLENRKSELSKERNARRRINKQFEKELSAQSVIMVNIEKLACLFTKYADDYQSFHLNKLTSKDSIYMIRGKVNITLQKFMACVHNIVCRGNCEGCDFPKLEFNYNLEKKGLNGYPVKGKIYNVLEDYGLQAWLEKHYKVICLHHVYNTELCKLIENTASYTELFELFSKSTVFDVKDYNIIDFLRFIAFIGNNGMPTSLYNIHDFKLHRCMF